MVRERKPLIPCVVCGDLMDRRLCQSQTCSADGCRAYLALYPGLADPTRTTRNRNRNRNNNKNSRRDTRALCNQTNDAMCGVADDVPALTRVAQLMISASVEEWYESVPSASRLAFLDDSIDNPWATRSMQVVALYLEARIDSPEASLLICLSPKVRLRTYLETEVFGRGVHYDVLLAWRCGCPEHHRVVYYTIDDIPQKVGYHDACPRCRHAPFELRRLKEGDSLIEIKNER